MFQVAKFASRSVKPCRLWIDNQQVVSGLAAMTADPHVDLAAKRDSDLWRHLQQQVRVAGNQITQVFKVQAHAHPAQQEIPLDTWATQGNHAADSAAAAARANLPASFWMTWSKLRDDVQHWRATGRQLNSMYVEIAVKAQHAKTIPETNVVSPVGIEPHSEPAVDAALLAVSSNRSLGMAS